MKEPPTWTAVYPHGTKEGNEELKFWNALARNNKYEWRSIGAIVKESGLSEQRVEELIQKYFKKGMVFQSPDNQKYWGYWERHKNLLPKEEKTVAQNDHDNRIGDILGSTESIVGIGCGAGQTLDELDDIIDDALKDTSDDLFSFTITGPSSPKDVTKSSGYLFYDTVVYPYEKMENDFFVIDVEA